MVWRPMSAELKFLKKDIAKHDRREGGERISQAHLLISVGSVLAMFVAEFKDIFCRFSKAGVLLSFWRPSVGLQGCIPCLSCFRTDLI